MVEWPIQGGNPWWAKIRGAGEEGARSMRDVLVVDDDDTFRAELAEALAERGYSVRQAATGRDAVQATLRDPPRAILLDYALPDTNGIDLLRLLRGRTATRSIPVILLTGHVRRELVESAGLLGVSDYLLKSMFSLSDLLARLESRIGPPTGDSRFEGHSAAVVTAAAALPVVDPMAFLRGVELRAFPGAVAEVLAMAEEPRASLADLDKILRRDPVLSARVLAASQTAALMRSSPTRNIEEALQVLGMSAVVRVVAAGAVLKREELESPWGKDIRQMWSHSIACAFLSQRLHEPKEEAFGFVLGLLHELAELLAIVHIGQGWGAVRQKGERSGWSTTDALGEAFKSPFPRLAREVLMRMRLPAGMSAILRELQDDDGISASRPSTGIVASAHQLSSLVNRSGSSLALVGPIRHRDFKGLRGAASLGDDIPSLEREIVAWEAMTGVRETLVSSRSDPPRALYLWPEHFATPDPFEALLRRECEVRRVSDFDGLFDDADLKVLLAEPGSAEWDQSVRLAGRVLVVHYSKADRPPGRTVRSVRLPASESRLAAILREG